MNREQLREHKETHTKENSYWLYDAKGIALSRVCHTCIKDVMACYKPEVFDTSKYEDVVEEPIYPDDLNDWDFGCQ
jgi:hypothetical protein